MCGILGCNFDADLTHAISTQTHRGPDHTGILKFGQFTLCHNRLSIIDLNPVSHQPFVSQDGRYAIVFNGEIYNYQTLKKDLEAKYPFRTHSDTEVLLYAYIEYGPRCLEKLQGMFAFAIYDRVEDRLFCARDRLGVKPFVWHFNNGKFIFASEIKGILSLLPHKPAMDPVALSQYLTYLYVPAPRTMFQGIAKLLPGHQLTLEKGLLSISPYWDLKTSWKTPTIQTETDLLAELDQRLDDAVRLRMISDVPLGAFLSGGLDSSAIVYYMQKNSTQPISTFTLGFTESRYDERSDAAIVSQHFNTHHHEILIQPEVAQLLPKMVHHFDEPFGNPTALLIYELTRKTKQHATVALAGDAGDEVFGGYPRYRGMQLAEALAWVPSILKSPLAKLATYLPESTTGAHHWRRAKEFLTSLAQDPAHRYESWVGYFQAPELQALLRHNPSFPRLVQDLWHESPGSDVLKKLSYVDLKSFLPYNILAYGDAMSMANAFEVRFPLLDHKVVELMGSRPGTDRIRNGQSKYLLHTLMKDRLPAEILAKKKQGLNPPMGVWLKTELAPLMADYLSPKTIQARGLFHVEPIQQLIREYHSNKRDVSLQLWALIVLEEWLRAYE